MSTHHRLVISTFDLLSKFICIHIHFFNKCYYIYIVIEFNLNNIPLEWGFQRRFKKSLSSYMMVNDTTLTV